MLLTITTSHCPATDLGYLLHKNPARVQTEELSFGKAHVFYPEAGESCCTAAVLLEVDPVALVRGRRGPAGESGQLEQYVNDRPYGANSFMSVALGRLFTTALNGKSKERQELAEMSIPLVAKLPVIAARGGEDLVRRLFEPLGYTLEITRLPLDDRFPEWGESPYVALEIRATTTLQKLLTHLYVLIPVLDNEKHYWVGEDEIEKLLKRGEGWLGAHPETELIVARYLKRQRSLTRAAMERLAEDAPPEEETTATRGDEEEEKVERPLGLHEQLNQMGEKQRGRIELIQGSLMYRDKRLEGYDAAAVVEVIEHLDGPRLAAFERVLFEFAKPGHVVVTTPNVEYNALFPTLPAGKLRHRDHRFEWTRSEFDAWANRMASRYGYAVRIQPVGPVDEALGAPTQMGIFARE